MRYHHLLYLITYVAATINDAIPPSEPRVGLLGLVREYLTGNTALKTEEECVVAKGERTGEEEEKFNTDMQDEQIEDVEIEGDDRGVCIGEQEDAEETRKVGEAGNGDDAEWIILGDTTGEAGEASLPLDVKAAKQIKESSATQEAESTETEQDGSPSNAEQVTLSTSEQIRINMRKRIFEQHKSSRVIPVIPLNFPRGRNAATASAKVSLDAYVLYLTA